MELGQKRLLMINSGNNGLSENQKIPKFQLLNESGDKWLSRRKIIGGMNTNLMELLPSKYSFAIESFKKSQSGHWNLDPKRLSGQREEYDSLSELEKKAFERTMCSINSVESLLFSNYEILIPYITAPEITLELSLLQYQSAKHTYAYSKIIESTTDKDSSENLYNLWRTTEELRRRNGLLNRKLMEFNTNPIGGNFLRNVVVSISSCTVVLYTEFSLLYALARKGKLIETSEVIKNVNRDLSVHASFLVSMYNTLVDENPNIAGSEFKKSVVNLLRDMVNVETDFVQFVSEGMIPGLSDLTLAKFSQSQANKILKGIKQETLYPGISGNPLPWFETFSGVK